MQEIIKITPAIKDYAWGNNSFIPQLVGKEISDKPQAELWMGCHQQGPCYVDGTDKTFAQFLDENPDFAGCTSKDFPYLFKVLAIAQPLSIQVHPNAEQAKQAFEAGNTNYSDPNPKAEMYYALTESTLMCGFKAKQTHDEDSDNMYKTLKSFWPEDPACLYAYKLNIIHLEPGEAVYLKPGIVHAYVLGNGIELMNNSDNVLRAGLTKKHIDKQELEKIMVQEPYNPNLMGSLEDDGGEHFYCEGGFSLTVMKDSFFRSKKGSVRILICTEGSATINETITVKKGDVYAVSKDMSYDIDVDGQVFEASC